MGPNMQGIAPWYVQPWQVQQGMPSNASQMPAMPSQMQGQYSNPTQLQKGFIVRPVASYDEAKAVPTDFMGNITVMPDFSNGFIYTKELDPNTGNPIFNGYKKVQTQETQPTHESTASPAYAEKVEVKKLQSELEKMQSEMEKLKEELGLTEKGEG